MKTLLFCMLDVFLIKNYFLLRIFGSSDMAIVRQVIGGKWILLRISCAGQDRQAHWRQSDAGWVNFTQEESASAQYVCGYENYMTA